MSPSHRNWNAEIAVAILVVALVVLSFFLVRQYRISVREGTISSERLRFAGLAHERPLAAADAGLIAPWMTFDYVSVSFKVPPAYLMDVLHISSSTAGYPNITLAHYARSVATSSAAFAAEVQKTVKDYLAGPGNYPASPYVPTPTSPSSSPSSKAPSSAVPIIPQED